MLFPSIQISHDWRHSLLEADRAFADWVEDIWFSLPGDGHDVLGCILMGGEL